MIEINDQLLERLKKIKTPFGDILFRFDVWLNYIVGQADKETFWLFFHSCDDTALAPWDRWTVFLLYPPYGEKYKTITRYISWMKRNENN